MIELRVRENRPSFKRKRDNYARKLKEKKLINYLRSELRTCTTHGLAYIVNTDIHWFERLFWAVSFIISVNIILALLWMQYVRYASTPVVTSVEMDYFNWNVSFPAITMCPMYKVDDDKLFQFVNATLQSTGHNIQQHMMVIATVSYDTAELLDFENLEFSDDEQIAYLMVLVPEEYSKLAANIYKKFDDNSLTTSNSWPISVDVTMTEMGMCHVINSNVAVLDTPGNTAESVKKNVDLTFYERDFFIQILNYADIYKVYIHGPNELIQSTSPSYTSKTNNHIEFGVRVWSTRISNTLRSAPINIRKCRFLDEPIGSRYPIYTYSHCIIECRIKMVLTLCDCVPHVYKTLPHERVCNLTELPCWIEHLKEVKWLSVSNETLMNSSSPDDLPRSPRDCGCVNDCDSDVYLKDHETFVPQENYNNMRVYISSFPKVRIVKDTIVNLYDIILRSGGVVNLCIGTSVISLVELIVLFLKITIGYVVRVLSVFVARCLQIVNRIKFIRGRKENTNKKDF